MQLLKINFKGTYLSAAKTIKFGLSSLNILDFLSWEQRSQRSHTKQRGRLHQIVQIK